MRKRLVKLTVVNVDIVVLFTRIKQMAQTPQELRCLNSKAWWLDDLTNGSNADGDASGENNKFRIIDATDINDAGVISATAIKCTVGGYSSAYDTTSHNSYCGGASSNAVEEVVAVKLVPIAGATKADIQARSADSEKVDRQGGSLGWLTLTVLGLLGFRRKFK